MKKPKLARVLGQPSYRIESDRVGLWVTKSGGMVGPITFDLGRGGTVEPMQVAPWAEEKVTGIPPMLKSLRGDWFCMPFGGNEKPFRSERYAAHGETANREWTLAGIERAGGRTTLRMRMDYEARPGRVEKSVSLVDGETNVYQRHVLSGFRGPMNVGHHATLKFPDREGAGRISTSPIVFGKVFPGEFESAAGGGYSSLKPGATFDALDQVPMKDGTTADLTRNPARRGYEDLVMVASDKSREFAWTAVWFERERFVWFALKDPRVLRSTIFWISNGGRWYAPWNGRHVNVLGLEEVTSYFHTGLAESSSKNDLNSRGIETALPLDPKRPTVVNYVFGVVAVPAGFGRVVAIDRADGGVRLTGESRKTVSAKVDLEFLRGHNGEKP